MSGLTSEQIMLRIERTDHEALRASANAFDTAAEAFANVRGRMNGVILDTHQMWDSTAGRSFGVHSQEVLRGLGDVGYTLGFLGRNLRDHAKVVEDAKIALPSLRKGPPERPYLTTDIALATIMERLAEVFHDSEIKVKKAFFSWGAQAPGKLPIPGLPPPEKLSWWEGLLFGPGPAPTWVTKDGDPWLGPGSPLQYPPGSEAERAQGEPYGYDEDGNLVPAWQAAYPDEYYPFQENGGGAIFRWVLRAGRGARGAQNADEFMDTVRASHGWRDGHINVHIREYYNLPRGADVPQWMRDEFTRLVRAAGENSGKVFRWDLRGTAGNQATNTIIYRDPNTKKWIAVQFYQNGPRAGEFATAFEPTPAQLNAMLRQNALG
jgi:uncharacterized protein YukE